ncbi:Telomere repeats-binding bouquet formation protein 1 [Araneus ventricosus]|uniref:Telomere repeats-binding bouquet formation protein 1 n=1 Tax=Araneus ventricosus TaxID=182803 RepID=A0A4Y2T1D7_ARAVE|nr:Telomere repeats-binding bouquet formation protein 1 [Araneus ventricosus]
MSFIFKFIFNSRNPHSLRSGPLTGDELKVASEYLIKEVQVREFSKEISALRKGNSILKGCGRDAFREEGGLDFLVEFLFLTDNTIFLEHTLKTLAFVIDENVHSQMYLSKKSVFEVLHTVWKKQSFPAAVQKNALVLMSHILYHNSTAQNLVFETGLLQDLLNMYEQYAQGLMINSSCMTSNLDNSVLNFWMSTNSTLCFAVNNPQNEKNQDICKNIFPVSLRILEFSSNSAVMGSVASFLTLTISDNAKCQDYFASCDGLLVLKRCFQKYFDTLLMDMKICNGITGKETYQAINNIVGIISPACLDHEKNAAICGDLGILSIMIKLLLMETFDCQLKTKIVLSLGHCIAACCMYFSCI